MSQLTLIPQTSTSFSNEIVDYIPAVFSPEESSLFLQNFITDTKWEHRKVMMYGKELLTPRLTAWYGDEGLKSEYVSSANMWTPDLLYVKARIEPLANTQFNSVLLNYYRDGNDSVAWHDDMDRVPGKNKIVASITFG